jgi:hypothetical protein
MSGFADGLGEGASRFLITLKAIGRYSTAENANVFKSVFY